MKRTLICAAAAVALAIPAMASGQVFQLKMFGEMDGIAGSSVKLKGGGTGDQLDLRSFAAKDFPVTCDDGSTAIMTRTKLKGTFPVGDQGGFHAHDDNGRTEFNVRGVIGNRASGKFHYQGEVAGEDGVTRSCDSGVLLWSARP